MNEIRMSPNELDNLSRELQRSAFDLYAMKNRIMDLLNMYMELSGDNIPKANDLIYQTSKLDSLREELQALADQIKHTSTLLTAAENEVFKSFN